MTTGDKFRCPLLGHPDHAGCAGGKDSRALTCQRCSHQLRTGTANGHPNTQMIAEYIQRVTGAGPATLELRTPLETAARGAARAVVDQVEALGRRQAEPDSMTALRAELAGLKQQIANRARPAPAPAAAPVPDAAAELLAEVRGLRAMLEDDRKPENALWLAASTLGRYKQQQAPPGFLELDQEDNLPVGLACLPDPQIGGSGTAYNLMIRDAEIISNTEGLWPLCPGDVVENFITPGKLAAASRGNVIQPDLQWDMAKDWIRRMRPKRPGDRRRMIIVPGNHDDFSISMASVEPLREIAEDLQAAYLRGSVARITFSFPSGTRYDIAFAHKFRMHSTLNLTHRPKQMIRFEAQWADIAIVGDRHEAAWEYCRMSNTDRVVVACDTYKCVDFFAASLNYSPARAIVPVIILSGDKKHMQVFSDLESGAAYLTHLRQLAQRGASA